MTSEIIAKFDPCMKELDAMIKRLETNLGKKHTISPFDLLRKKYQDDQLPLPKEGPKEEKKKEEKKPDNQIDSNVKGGGPSTDKGA